MRIRRFAVKLLYLVTAWAIIPIHSAGVAQRTDAEDASASKHSVVKVVEEKGAFHLIKDLTKGWKQYRIDLKGKDLSRVKAGFGWTVDASGEPVTFYLDDVRFE